MNRCIAKPQSPKLRDSNAASPRAESATTAISRCFHTAWTVLGRSEMLPRLLLAPIVAVVGARNASANGRRLARDLAAELGEAGIIVVSGLARGIDAAAHLGALETGSVAVVAGGADIVYPEE